ncbi:MAG: hypothetical protein J0L52_12190 [Caulobacterales bacterium]|nr:hypothetical protein [Caulobacterales bacterium]
MRKRFIVLGLAAAVSAFFGAAVMARPVGEVRFSIQNGGSSDLSAFSLSRPTSEAWGMDRLGGAAIAPGGSTVIVLQPSLGGCLYDMKASFTSGGDARLFAVDVCRLNGAEIILTD